MRKHLAVYYHIWSPPRSAVWRFLVDEQLKHIFRSGVAPFAHIRCCITGQDHVQIAHFLREYPAVEIIESTADESQFEGTTLKHLYEACQTDDALDGVCYLHTKGITALSTICSDQMFRYLNSWRHFLEWGVLDHWQDAVAKLDRHDVAGVDYQAYPWPHMSGNFWWAKPMSRASPIRRRGSSRPAPRLTATRAPSAGWISSAGSASMTRPSIVSTTNPRSVIMMPRIAASISIPISAISSPSTAASAGGLNARRLWWGDTLRFSALRCGDRHRA
jgi:hypothetical protein